MLLLSLIWFGIGILLALMAYAARLQPLLWHSSSKWSLFTYLIIGAVISLCSGWLGILLFGRLFSIATILCITIACLVILPRVIVRVQTNFKGTKGKALL
jgi:hypothetical protein